MCLAVSECLWFSFPVSLAPGMSRVPDRGASVGLVGWSAGSAMPPRTGVGPGLWSCRWPCFLLACSFPSGGARLGAEPQAPGKEQKGSAWAVEGKVAGGQPRQTAGPLLLAVAISGQGLRWGRGSGSLPPILALLASSRENMIEQGRGIRSPPLPCPTLSRGTGGSAFP